MTLKTQIKLEQQPRTDSLTNKLEQPNQASVFTTEVQTIKMALAFIKNSNKQKFVIFIDCLSSFVDLNLGEFKYSYILDILETYIEIVINREI